MTTVVIGRSGDMSNIGSSIDATRSDNSVFTHGAFANHVFDHEGLLQPNGASLPSYTAHGKVSHLQKTCAECFHTFSTNSNLEQHASSSGHTSFSCMCGAQFSRAYTLTRHINSMIGPGFPCELCDDKAFPRLDKLCDHLRRYHRLGGKAFDLYKGGNSPSISSSLSLTGNHPLPAEALGQAYPVVSEFGSVSMFDGFSSASNTGPYSSSVGTSVSPQSSTAAGECWVSHPGNNTAYPL